MRYDSILDAIGNTPHIRLSRLFPEHEVWLKLEKQNPGGSIKDRIALAMIEDAERDDLLKPGGTIIEPTSGNTGIGLAMVAAIKGYRMIITMPESMSVERRRVMAAFGAELVLTPRELGMKGAIQKAAELAAEIEGAWIPQQFENPANPEVHSRITAKEILFDFPEGFDYFVTGVGTGGHITGIGSELKDKCPGLKIVAVEPELSPVISGGSPAPHPIQGIGAGFIPANLDVTILHSIEKVGKDDAFEYTRKLARTEGIFAGISTGASLAAVANVLSESGKGTRILTMNYDMGERYLSVEGLY